MRLRCWSCGATVLLPQACPLCGAAHHRGASIRLVDIDKLEEDVRVQLAMLARTSNSTLKHGERELTQASAAAEQCVSGLLRAIADMRKAVRRDVEAELSAAQAELNAAPALHSVP